MRRRRHITPEMAELLNEYIDLIDEECYERALKGKASRELRKDIADCERRIDIERKASIS